MKQLVVTAGSTALGSGRGQLVVPAIVAALGAPATRRFREFFIATIRNAYTRAAYHRAVLRFCAWCDQHQVGGLIDIAPLHVATYIETLTRALDTDTWDYESFLMNCRQRQVAANYQLPAFFVSRPEYFALYNSVHRALLQLSSTTTLMAGLTGTNRGLFPQG